MERTGTRLRRIRFQTANCVFNPKQDVPSHILCLPIDVPIRQPIHPHHLIPNPSIGDWQGTCLQPALVAPALARTKTAFKRKTPFSDANHFVNSPSPHMLYSHACVCVCVYNGWNVEIE